MNELVNCQILFIYSEFWYFETICFHSEGATFGMFSDTFLNLSYRKLHPENYTYIGVLWVKNMKGETKGCKTISIREDGTY